VPDILVPLWAGLRAREGPGPLEWRAYGCHPT